MRKTNENKQSEKNCGKNGTKNCGTKNCGKNSKSCK